MDEVQKKRCKGCGVEFPATLEFFYAAKTGIGGLNARCKQCYLNNKHRHYQEHREEALARQHRYIVANREKVNEGKRKRRNSDKERERRKSNRNAISHNNHNYYMANRETILERQRLRRYNRAGKIQEHITYTPEEKRARWREKSRLRRLNNPEAERAKTHRYRARKRNAKGSYTAQDIHLIRENQRNKCWWCGKSLEGGYHIDHRIPLARGGSNDPSNLVLTCAPCNLSKQDKLPSEWGGRLL